MKRIAVTVGLDLSELASGNGYGRIRNIPIAGQKGSGGDSRIRLYHDAVFGGRHGRLEFDIPDTFRVPADRCAILLVNKLPTRGLLATLTTAMALGRNGL